MKTENEYELKHSRFGYLFIDKIVAGEGFTIATIAEGQKEDLEDLLFNANEYNKLLNSKMKDTIQTSDKIIEEAKQCVKEQYPDKDRLEQAWFTIGYLKGHYDLLTSKIENSILK